MKINFLMRSFAFLLSLLGATTLYATEGEEKENHNIEIKLWNTGKAMELSGLDLTKTTIKDLYPAIEKAIKKFTPQQKIYLGIKGDNEEKAIEAYMEQLKQPAGLFCIENSIVLDFLISNQEYLFFKNDMLLEKVRRVDNHIRLKVFLPHQVVINFWKEEKIVEHVDITVGEPYMSLNTILDQAEECLSEEVKKDYLQNSSSPKLGLAIVKHPYDTILYDIAYPPGSNQTRSVLKENAESQNDKPPTIDVSSYHFTIKMPHGEQSIQVEGINSVASLKEVRIYLEERDVQIEKIATKHGFLLDLHTDEDKKLYKVGFNQKGTYRALVKGGYHFLIDFPSKEKAFSSLCFNLDEKSSVKDLYDVVSDFLSDGESDRVPFAGPILIGNREISKRGATSAKSLEEIGIESGSRVVAFEPFPMYVDMPKGNLTIQMTVSSTEKTFEEFQKDHFFPEHGYLLFSGYHEMISPTAKLAMVKQPGGQYTLFLAEANRVGYFTYKNTHGITSWFHKQVRENDTIASYTRSLQYCLKLPELGAILLTQHGKEVGIQHALNRIGSDSVDLLLYNSSINPHPVQITRYFFTVKWMEKGASKSKRITDLQPYQTIQDLINKIGWREDDCIGIVVNGKKKYPKKLFSTTTLVDLGAEVHQEINLTLVKEGDTTTFKDDTGLENGDDAKSNGHTELANYNDSSNHNLERNHHLLIEKDEASSDHDHGLGNSRDLFPDSNHYVGVHSSDIATNHEEEGERWLTDYFYWIAIGVPLTFVVVIGGCWLLMKKKMMTLFSKNKRNKK